MPDFFSHILTNDWKFFVQCALHGTLIICFWKLLGHLTDLRQSITVFRAEHETLMYAKASADGCSRQYLADTAVAAAKELERFRNVPRNRKAENGKAHTAGMH